MSLFDTVRAACAEVAARARHVRIDEGRIPTYADSLPLEQATAPALDPAHHYLDPQGDPEGTLGFVMTLEAINFGSGYFLHLTKLPGLSGYFTVATHLTAHFRHHGPLDAQHLAVLTPIDCARVFGQDPANATVMELMGLFAHALNDLGLFLCEEFDGRFAAAIEAADGSADRLVSIVRRMPFFDDVQAYGGLRVPFFKRAQLAAADLNLAFGGERWGYFDDLDRLTVFADNLVPHVLRLDGVLVYDPDLVERIDREDLLEPGSPEEIEIRGCAVHAAELIKQELHRRGNAGVTSMGLDYLLWNRGQQPAYKRAKPRHRCRTVFY